MRLALIVIACSSNSVLYSIIIIIIIKMSLEAVSPEESEISSVPHVDHHIIGNCCLKQ